LIIGGLVPAEEFLDHHPNPAIPSLKTPFLERVEKWLGCISQ